MNGGLNNAALAIELALAASADAEAATQDALRAGLAAVTQASRAAMLLSQLVRPQPMVGEPAEGYMQDVRDIVRTHARLARCEISPAFDAAAGAAHAGAEDAARLLVAEIARIDASRAG